MHAQLEGAITCSALDCVQPGTVLIDLTDWGDTFEFCEYHAERLPEGTPVPG